MKLIVATHNQHKIREISQILPDFEIIADDPDGVEESAPDFAGNALIKVRAIAAKHAGAWCLADDSGLEVEALGGEPGVYSVRWAGEGKTDHERNLMLLERMRSVPETERGAKFVCVAACVFPGGKALAVRGECRGTILDEERGNGGFGYDPIFVPEGYEKTFAELPSEVKNGISHRAHAMEGLKNILLSERK